MKICFMTRTVHPTKGGTTKYFYVMTQELKKQGHHITLICTDKLSDKNTYVDDLILIQELRIPLIGRFITKALFGLLAFLKVRGQRSDAYCFESGYLGIWTLLFKLAGKRPLVSFSMRYGWDYLKASLRNKDIILQLRFKFIPYILWELVFSINEVLDVCFADKVLVLNSEAIRLWVSKRISASKLEIVPFGIDLSIYGPVEKDDELLKELGLKEQDIVILYAGHLDAMRKPDKAVQAFSILLKKSEKAEFKERLKLLVVGSGPLEKSIKKAVVKSGLEQHVRFLPHIHDENKLNKIYNLGTLLILPNPPGTMALMATACGLPVITIRNKSGFLGSIDTKLLDNFILIDSIDAGKIAEAGYELLNAPGKMQDIADKGKEISKDYSWEKVAVRLSELLKQFTADKP